ECFSQQNPNQPPSVPPFLQPGNLVVDRQDYGVYQAGPYWAFNSPWGATAPGTYSQSITCDSANFPKNTFMVWDYPSTGAPYSVFGYPDITYGNFVPMNSV